MSYSQICGADAVVVSRPLLYFGTRHTIEPWAERLCSEEWQLRYAENINELQKLSSAAEFKVGIVAPDHREIINNCRCVESTIARAGHIRWIVLLPKDALDSPPLRELVSATFYDYHTLPVDSDRLPKFRD